MNNKILASIKAVATFFIVGGFISYFASTFKGGLIYDMLSILALCVGWWAASEVYKKTRAKEKIALDTKAP
jgi:hypothetical protein